MKTDPDHHVWDTWLLRTPDGEIVDIGVFVPLAFCFEWVIQAHTGFCVRLALLNGHNFSGAGGSAGRVTDATDRREDRLQAAKVTAVAVTVAAVTTAALVFVLG